MGEHRKFQGYWNRSVGEVEAPASHINETGQSRHTPYNIYKTIRWQNNLVEYYEREIRTTLGTEDVLYLKRPGKAQKRGHEP